MRFYSECLTSLPLKCRMRCAEVCEIFYSCAFSTFFFICHVFFRILIFLHIFAFLLLHVIRKLFFFPICYQLFSHFIILFERKFMQFLMVETMGDSSGATKRSKQAKQVVARMKERESEREGVCHREKSQRTAKKSLYSSKSWRHGC